MLHACALCLCVRALEPVTVVLRAISGDVERLALQLLGTHLLDRAAAANELGATCTLELTLFTWVLEVLLPAEACSGRCRGA